MIDISQYGLLTPTKSALNVRKPLTLFYRSGEIITFQKGDSATINLEEVAGAQDEDFNLVFTNRSKEYVEKCKKSEDFLQAIYSIFNFEVGDFTEVEQYNELEFLDAMYYNNEPTEVKDNGKIIL